MLLSQEAVPDELMLTLIKQLFYFSLQVFVKMSMCVSLQLFTTKAQSLLLMTSVAMPVFSKKKETVGWNPTLAREKAKASDQ